MASSESFEKTAEQFVGSEPVEVPSQLEVYVEVST